MDYEKANAAEWDLHAKENKKSESASNSWQVVRSSKRPTKTPQPAPPPTWHKATNAGSKKSEKLPQHASPQGFQKRPGLGFDKATQLPDRSSPQKWQNATGTVKDTQPRFRPPPKLLLDPTSEAQQSWRNREAPKESIRIPGELIFKDKTHTSIARHFGAFIFSEEPKSRHGNVTFGIWGDSEAVAATKQAINQWIDEYRSAKSGRPNKKFATVASLTPGLWEQEERKWRKEVKRYRLRQFPPPDTGFGAIGSFHWPVQEYKPEEILGTSYEALDPIRMDCSCYVVFRQERGTFEVMGKAEKVREGLLRLRRTCFQIAARQITPLRLYLLHWPDASTLPSHLTLDPYEYLDISSGDNSAKTRTGWLPRGEGANLDDARLKRQTALSEDRLRSSLLQTLAKLHYYRGAIILRIRWGKFVATQYKKPAKENLYELDEYEDMLTASQFMGFVTQELGDEAIEQGTLGTLSCAKDILTPQNHEGHHVKPVYSAVFTFGDAAGDLRLTASWEIFEDTGSSSFKWARLERDTGAPSTILDISLTDLNTGMAWQFDCQAAQPVSNDHVPKPLQDFAESVRIDLNEAQKASTDKPFVTHRPYVGHLKSVQQRTTYRYNIASSEYTLELTRFQTRTFPPRKSTFLPAPEATVYEPRCGLSVYRGKWDLDFTDNERLEIGQRADWSHDVDTWFPKDVADSSGDEKESASAGFGQLMEKLKVIGRLVLTTKGEEDLVGGMTVG